MDLDHTIVQLQSQLVYHSAQRGWARCRSRTHLPTGHHPQAQIVLHNKSIVIVEGIGVGRCLRPTRWLNHDTNILEASLEMQTMCFASDRVTVDLTKDCPVLADLPEPPQMARNSYSVRLLCLWYYVGEDGDPEGVSPCAPGGAPAAATTPSW
jgi:hypothetical protein